MALFRSDTDRMPKAGDLLADKYRVEAVIGHGGMGVVVAAVHRDLGQRVAIKVMFEAARQTKDSVARFLREAQTASMLRNDHSVRILDVGRLKRGEPYIVMEFLAGTDLAHVLTSRGPLPYEEAVDYTLQACEAIAEAHRLGIVHRDLKPANLFLTTRTDGFPCVKVLDFGISKVSWLAATGFAPDLTATMEAMGTPVYMSPEQVRAQKVIDPRMDIWALGVVLYELMVGQPPFWADTLPAISARIVSDTPVPLRVHRPEVPAGLDSIVLACLEKPQDLRPPNILELARALEPWASPAGKQSVRQIEGIVQLPVEALSSQPIALPKLDGTGARGWQAETNHAWGTTRGRLSRGTRVGLLGVGTGIAAAFVAVVIWFLFMRTPSDVPSRSVASDTATASASVANLAAEPVPSASSEPATSPWDSSSASAPAASSVAPAATPSRKKGGRGRDPLDERY